MQPPLVRHPSPNQSRLNDCLLNLHPSPSLTNDWFSAVTLQEEARKADIAEKVAAGLLPPDVLAEDLEMLPDAVDEIIGDEEFEEDVSGVSEGVWSADMYLCG
eukprot:1153412-Pelagomonas_calceolata.AAC.7